jgi:GNAT superfamily N-acetyltransferase
MGRPVHAFVHPANRLASRTVIREIVPPGTALAHRAMRELRPHMGDEEAFVRRVDDVQRPEGYRLVGAFDEGEPNAVAVAGFRVMHSLHSGDALYVDDLSTLPEARGRGHGRGLLDWMLEEARRLRCTQFHLDSAVGPEREDAHRLYFNAGMRIVSYHFARGVGPP